ncbi:helix-turn-helix transcriptional regulator [Dyella sp.]|uniref:helix-turn-helix transcriptional regulator n=1 Tax=Dyella sp. TaxID=1869338 RepID=UPI003F7E0E12
MYARVREARGRTKKSQEDFAALLEVSRGAVAQWEMEHGTTPSVKNLAEIAKVTGVAFEWLATGRGPKVFGEPVLREEPARYAVPLSPDLVRVVELAKKWSPEKLRALIVLLES